MIQDELQDIFRRVFEDDTIELVDEMDASDVAAWDSLNHINLIVEVERHFDIKFRNSEIARMQCVGDLIGIIEKKQTT